MTCQDHLSNHPAHHQLRTELSVPVQWRVTVESVTVESVIGVQGTTIMIDRDGSVTIDS